ncbi:MAG: GNAT family N-acetyltransferase [Ginsengibacter sp.]
MSHILNISTPRLRIRNLHTSDLPEFYAYRSNPEVTKYQGFDVMTMEEAKKFIEEQKDQEFGKVGEWVQYGIENLKTKKVIGDCAVKLDALENRIAEVGITISDLHQKQGYAKETLKGLLSFLFNNNICRVVETVDSENVAAVSLLRSIGFRQEAHFIENIFFKGEWASEFQFAMLKREWEG